MIQIPFVKMHGAGNDYVFVDDGLTGLDLPASLSLPDLARSVSRRHWGIGSDGLIVLSPGAGHPVAMRMFNADGSEGKLCLNGLRCAAKYAADRLDLLGPGFVLETASGDRAVTVERETRDRSQVTVRLGSPDFRRSVIPARGEGDELWGETVTVAGRDHPAYGVSVGNPHLVLWLASPEAVGVFPLESLKPLSEDLARFPEGANVHVAAAEGRDRVATRPWERGSGATQACGSGAVAVFAVARRLGAIDAVAAVDMPGGSVELREEDEGLVLRGPAEEVFTGLYRMPS